MFRDIKRVQTYTVVSINTGVDNLFAVILSQTEINANIETHLELKIADSHKIYVILLIMSLVYKDKPPYNKVMYTKKNFAKSKNLPK